MAAGDLFDLLFAAEYTEVQRKVKKRAPRSTFPDLVTWLLTAVDVLHVVTNAIDPLLEADMADSDANYHIYKRNTYAAMRHIAVTHWQALAAMHGRLIVFLGMALNS
jgi:hypothetical protein